jgi:hypothetical protein
VQQRLLLHLTAVVRGAAHDVRRLYLLHVDSARISLDRY